MILAHLASRRQDAESLCYWGQVLSFRGVKENQGGCARSFLGVEAKTQAIPVLGTELLLNERQPSGLCQPTKGSLGRAVGDPDSEAKPACSHYSTTHTPKAHVSRR